MKCVLQISVYRHQVFAFMFLKDIYKNVLTLLSIMYLQNTYIHITYVTLTPR